MRLTVVTPIGPGHEAASRQCQESVEGAWRHSRGLFYAIRHVLWDDHEGKLGRSRARNEAVAANPDADWYFFLDADDLLQPEAFERFWAAIEEDPAVVAVFGAIHTDRNGTIPENVHPLDWDGLLHHGARGTLSMGCFVRADVARLVRFDEDMDAAEDFDFYLRLLHGRRWTKVAEPLVTIRRFVKSAVGPRGYTALDWRGACGLIVEKWKACPPTAAPIAR